MGEEIERWIPMFSILFRRAVTVGRIKRSRLGGRVRVALGAGPLDDKRSTPI